MMSEETTVLKTVPASTPKLLHSDSKRSVAASDDYYSCSDHASEQSSDEKTTVIRYQTPPSLQKLEKPRLETVKAAQAQEENEKEDLTPTEKQSTVRFAERNSIPRKPVATENMKNWREMQSEVSPPTPGVDDTPYIQFAIDQLTRDEELTGRSRDPGGSQAISPISERFPEEELDPEHRGDASQTIRPAPAYTRDSPVSPISSGDGHPDAIVTPAQPAPDLFQFPPLDFVPLPLRAPIIAGLVFFCLAIIAALIFCSVWSSKHNGLWTYDGVGTAKYWVTEFLPGLLAGMITIWMTTVQQTLQRILPYALLARKKPGKDSDIIHNVPLFITNFLIPDLSLFKHGEPALGLCNIVFWLCLFTVPLQSCLFQTSLYYDANGNGVWTWTVVQPVAWTLIGLYFLLVAALCAIPVKFLRRITGLKWDPVSIADIFAILRKSSSGIIQSASQPTSTTMQQRGRPVSLGYYESSRHPGRIQYGINEPTTSTSLRNSAEKGGNPSQQSRYSRRSAENYDLEAGPQPSSTFESWQSAPTNRKGRSPRYSFTPWFLRDFWVATWLSLAVVLMILWVVVSYIHQNVSSGFLPLLPSPANGLGFSPSNFVYSLIPALIGMFLYLIWQPIDVYFRALQPFANMAQPEGATVEKSLLLHYHDATPLAVPIKAAAHGHYKVAWFSLMSYLSMAIPILAGGVFTAQFQVQSQQIKESADMPAYAALVVFMVLYTFSYLAIWPTKKRYLPHDVRTLGDMMGYAGGSGLVRGGTFRELRGRVDLVTRLMVGGGGAGVGSVAGQGRRRVRYGFKQVVGEGWVIDRL